MRGLHQTIHPSVFTCWHWGDLESHGQRQGRLEKPFLREKIILPAIAQICWVEKELSGLEVKDELSAELSVGQC